MFGILTIKPMMVEYTKKFNHFGILHHLPNDGALSRKV